MDNLGDFIPTAAASRLNVPLSRRELLAYLSELLRMLRDAFRCGRSAFLTALIIRIIRSTLPPLLLFVIKSLIDQIASTVHSPSPIRCALGVCGSMSLVYTLAGMGFLLFFSAALAKISDHLDRTVANHYKFYLSTSMINKVDDLSLRSLERTSIRSKIENAKNYTRVSSAVISLTLNSFQSILTCLFYLVGVFLVSHLVALFFIASWVAVICFDITNSIYRQLDQSKLAHLFKFQDYLLRLATGLRSFREVRTLNLSQLIVRQYERAESMISAEQKRLKSGQIAVSLALTFFAVLIQLVVFAIAAREAFNHSLTLGSVALILMGLFRAMYIMQSVMNNLSLLATHSTKLADAYGFLRLREEDEGLPEGREDFPLDFKTITFRGVSYKYEGSDNYALKEASFELRRGEVAAIVGVNGAGKSTIAKLLAGLYAPTSGAIYFDDVNMRSIDRSQLPSSISVLHQDFMRFQLRVVDNVRFGDLSAHVTEEKISAALMDAGADPDDSSKFELPTLLGGVFEGGRELSGGEWKKLALARCYLKHAALYIFDEPAAHLDAGAQAAFYEKIHALKKHAAVVLISHNISKTRMADRTLLFMNGRLVAAGPHLELLDRNLMYASLFSNS